MSSCEVEMDVPEKNVSKFGCDVTRKNLRFRMFAYKMGYAFCVTPWYDRRKQCLKWPMLNRVYASVYGLCIGILLVATLATKEKNYYANTFEQVLATFSDVISIVLMEFLIFGSAFTKQRTFDIFLKKYCGGRQILENYDYENITTFYLQFILSHICFAAIFIYNWYICTFVATNCSHLAFASTFIPAYYCYFTTLLASNVILAIKCKYKELNKYLVKQINLKLSGGSEKQFVNSVLDIGKYYRDIEEVVQYYNAIFGWVIVFIFWHSIVELLRCPNLFLKMRHDPFTFWTMFLSLFLTSSLSMGESVYIILCCDSATSAGKKMAQLCHKLQENFEVDSKSRKELFKLADIARSYEPKFTAANFFHITKGTILGIIEIATTYLIVIIQFNGVLEEK